MSAFDVNVIASLYPFRWARIAIIPSSAYGGGIVKIRLVIIWYLWGIQGVLLWWTKWKNTKQNCLVCLPFEQFAVKRRHWALQGEEGENKSGKWLFKSALFFLKTEWGRDPVEKKVVLATPGVQDEVSDLFSTKDWKECLVLHENSLISLYFVASFSLQSMASYVSRLSCKEDGSRWVFVEPWFSFKEGGMKKQKSELLAAETLLSLCLSNLSSYETFWNLSCWCLSDPQNYSCANVDTQQGWYHWLRKTHLAYQKLQDSNNVLATPAFFFFSFLLIVCC